VGAWSRGKATVCLLASIHASTPAGMYHRATGVHTRCTLVDTTCTLMHTPCALYLRQGCQGWAQGMHAFMCDACTQYAMHGSRSCKQGSGRHKLWRSTPWFKPLQQGPSSTQSSTRRLSWMHILWCGAARAAHICAAAAGREGYQHKTRVCNTHWVRECVYVCVCARAYSTLVSGGISLNSSGSSSRTWALCWTQILHAHLGRTCRSRPRSCLVSCIRLSSLGTHDHNPESLWNPSRCSEPCTQAPATPPGSSTLLSDEDSHICKAWNRICFVLHHSQRLQKYLNEHSATPSAAWLPSTWG